MRSYDDYMNHACVFFDYEISHHEKTNNRSRFCLKQSGSLKASHIQRITFDPGTSFALYAARGTFGAREVRSTEQSLWPRCDKDALHKPFSPSFLILVLGWDDDVVTHGKIVATCRGAERRWRRGTRSPVRSWGIDSVGKSGSDLSTRRRLQLCCLF